VLVKFCPKLGSFIFIFPPALAPTAKIFRVGWICAQNRWNVSIAYKGTYSFTDDVNYVPPAVDAVNVFGFEFEEEGDRFLGNKSS
jgi:hypothetical protein